MHNSTNLSKTVSTAELDIDGKIMIPLYGVMFLLSILGNIFVFYRNRRFRNITNAFLLNLSVSDILLAVFCMPFSLIPLLMKNFVFGEVMCVAIRYLQG